MASSGRRRVFVYGLWTLFRSGVQKLAGCRSALEASSISLSCSGPVAENRVRCQGAVRLSLT